jgi:hypothetical protein
MEERRTMTEGETHKFHSKLETTYYDHQKTRYEGMVEIAREMKKELGKEKALEIVGRVCDRMAVASVEKMTGVGVGDVVTVKDENRPIDESIGL